MKFARSILEPCARALGVLGIAIALAAAMGAAHAQGYASLPVVKPVESCGQLGKTDLSGVAETPATIQSATLINTPKGQFCKVIGNIEPSIGFEVDLPVDHWTQRYLEGGCGGLCGMRAVGITNASTCAPALNGEFALAGDDMGHETQMGSPAEAEFARDPQKRIDFAYRGNHDTTLVAKALIKDFYGQAPRYSYFVGCSDGGREALEEAQRYPDDFDGISAGDPAALFVIQNSFYHAWNALSDKRADGTNILLPNKLQILHAAVIAKCPTLSGVNDGLLQDPGACDFDPASIQCQAGATDTSRCLTSEEVGVVRAQYGGATDGQGHTFTYGAQKGGEALWVMSLPTTANGTSMSAGMASRSVSMVILPQISPADADISKFQFTVANFNRMAQLAPLYDATNTDLKPYAAHGGKLILWHGLSDTSITPGVSLEYYQAVQRFMGKAETAKFLEYFLLPGVWHCGGGDGYDQVDLLSPLMAWTELGQAPKDLIAGKLAQAAGPGGPGGPAGRRGGMPSRPPYATPAPHYVATRPVYPYPYIPHYTGMGDPNDAANYVPVKGPGALFGPDKTEQARLIGPDNQKFYKVVNGQLVAE